MVLNQKRRCVRTSLQVSLKTSQPENRQKETYYTCKEPVEKMQAVTEIICCSSCWEVQHINGNALMPSCSDASIISPTLRNVSPLLAHTESPVLGKRTTREDSPILTRTSSDAIINSPVIGRYTARKRTKEVDVQIEQVTQDVFTQLSCYNVNTDIESQSPPPSPFKISQTFTQISESSNSIEMVLSQGDNKTNEIVTIIRNSPPLSYKVQKERLGETVTKMHQEQKNQHCHVATRTTVQ